MFADGKLHGVLEFALRAPLVTLHAREEKEVEVACLGVLRLPGEIRSAKKGANSWRRRHEREKHKISSQREEKVARRRANLAMEIEFPRRKFSGDSLCYFACATQHREQTFAKHHKLRESLDANVKNHEIDIQTRSSVSNS